MKGITEDYVSEEIAKLLQMKGFDEPCDSYYEWFESGVTLYKGYMPEFYHGRYKPVSDMLHLKMPTIQMTLKWLREAHDLCVYCYPSSIEEFGKWEVGACYIKDNVSVIFNNNSYSIFANSYEKAMESTILYILKNLI